MADYRLSSEARNDLIRMHQHGIRRFGTKQADRYFENFFSCFDIIADRPFSFESADGIRKGYRKCVCSADTVFFRINDKVVEIMAIIGQQDLEEWL
ncbi:MAG: type II toxin-antitoxin system RelE/ParE family toxin [Cyclobacteriaceae bacterium]